MLGTVSGPERVSKQDQKYIDLALETNKRKKKQKKQKKKKKKKKKKKQKKKKETK